MFLVQWQHLLTALFSSYDEGMVELSSLCYILSLTWRHISHDKEVL